MANDPLWIDASGGVPAYNAAELRQAMALPMLYGGRNMGARQGVRPGGNQLFVSLAGSTITVQPGVALIDPGLTTPQGPYWVALTPASTHTLTAADPTNPRKDIVVLRVYDNTEDSSGLREARTEYLAGTPAGSPSEPAVPAGAIKLALIDVPASPGTPVVTDRRPYAVAAGGMLPVADATERNALTAYNGLTVWRLDLRRMEHYDGSAWRTTVAVVNIYTTGSGTWTKPLGAKTVWVRARGGSGGSGGAQQASSNQHANGGGGGQGSYAESWLSADSLGTTAAYAVGAGGTAGANTGGNGGSGGTTTFNSTTVQAPGGSGGSGGTTSAATFGVAGGAGGTGATGDYTEPGAPGGWAFGGDLLGAGGNGGGAGAGAGRVSAAAAQALAGNAGSRGGGAGGALTTSGSASGAAGAVGGDGWLIVVAFL